jgi:hypothetical protein
MRTAKDGFRGTKDETVKLGETLDIHFDTHDTTDTFVKKIVSNKKAKFIYRKLIDKIVQNPT